MLMWERVSMLVVEKHGILFALGRPRQEEPGLVVLQQGLGSSANFVKVKSGYITQERFSGLQLEGR